MRRVDDKQLLRERIRRLVRGLASEYRTNADSSICRRILGLDSYARCKQVLLYVALSDEVALDDLIAAARTDGKAVYVPVMDPGSCTLRFALWSPGQGLVLGADGVRVPPEIREPPDRPSAVVVPGRAFDRQGYRVGRGRGCYDRALVHLSSLGPTIGAAYACQIVERVPRQEHDQTVAWVVTEDETIHCAAARGGTGEDSG